MAKKLLSLNTICNLFFILILAVLQASALSISVANPLKAVEQKQARRSLSGLPASGSVSGSGSPIAHGSKRDATKGIDQNLQKQARRLASARIPARGSRSPIGPGS